MELNYFDLVKRVIVSPKSQLLLKKRSQLTLEVDSRANKPLVKRAVETIWNDVKVEKVAILNVPGVAKRFKGKAYYAAGYKKAIVTIKQQAGSSESFTQPGLST